MQALLDGKIVTGFNFKLKLNGRGELVVEGVDSWNPSSNDLNYIIDVVEEYPLTFKEALKAMLDGKVVMCKEPFHGYAYRFHNGRFEDSHVNDCFTRWEQCGMPSFRQDSKWKVVE